MAARGAGDVARGNAASAARAGRRHRIAGPDRGAARRGRRGRPGRRRPHPRPPHRVRGRRARGGLGRRGPLGRPRFVDLGAARRLRARTGLPRDVADRGRGVAVGRGARPARARLGRPAPRRRGRPVHRCLRAPADGPGTVRIGLEQAGARARLRAEHRSARRAVGRHARPPGAVGAAGRLRSRDRVAARGHRLRLAGEPGGLGRAVRAGRPHAPRARGAGRAARRDGPHRHARRFRAHARPRARPAHVPGQLLGVLLSRRPSAPGRALPAARARLRDAAPARGVPRGTGRARLPVRRARGAARGPACPALRRRGPQRARAVHQQADPTAQRRACRGRDPRAAQAGGRRRARQAARAGEARGHLVHPARGAAARARTRSRRRAPT